MIRLGFHLPTSGGWPRIIEAAVTRRCNTCQIFTGAPVRWARPAFDPDGARWFTSELQRRNIWPLFVHAPYLLNPATDQRWLQSKTLDTLIEECNRSAMLQAAGLVLHLGSAGSGGSITAGVSRTARLIDQALEAAESDVPVLLENCAGQGNLVGGSVEQTGDIIGLSRYPERLRFCLDTAHAFAAGYAVNTPDGLNDLFSLIDSTLGPERLALVHANDSLGDLGSRRDRHWHIGEGKIGLEGFRLIANHPRLDGLCLIMETPGTGDDDLRNMRRMRRIMEPGRRPPMPRLR